MLLDREASVPVSPSSVPFLSILWGFGENTWIATRTRERRTEAAKKYGQSTWWLTREAPYVIKAELILSEEAGGAKVTYEMI